MSYSRNEVVLKWGQTVDKVFASANAAIADIGEGSSIAVAGFSVGHGFPSSLLVALRDKGTRDLCIVCNSLGGPGQLRALILVENKQVSKLIASFSARPGVPTVAEHQIAVGELELELVPQGTLVERLRAGGAGIAAFYTRTGIGTEIASGKEIRTFNGQPYLLEHGIRVDFAFLRAFRADRVGNLQFRGGNENFNPSFAKAARVAIAEVDEIVEVGEISPEQIGLPGIFVSRVVQRTVKSETTRIVANSRRSGETARTYNGKPALPRKDIARRAAILLGGRRYVNLGVGIPTLLSSYLGGNQTMLHAENGILGYRSLHDGESVDQDYFNAGGEFVGIVPGASFFDSITSFEMARSNRLDVVVLGAYQVDEQANFANWSTPEMVGGGIGGAMDLVAGDSSLIIVMEHLDGKGRPKLVKECSYPLTAEHRVEIVVTDLALLRWTGEYFLLEEVAEGFDVDEVRDLMEMKVVVAERVRTMQRAFDEPQ